MLSNYFLSLMSLLPCSDGNCECRQILLISSKSEVRILRYFFFSNLLVGKTVLMSMNYILLYSYPLLLYQLTFRALCLGLMQHRWCTKILIVLLAIVNFLLLKAHPCAVASEKQQLIIQHKLKKKGEIASELIAVVKTGIVNIKNFPGCGL